jgi:sorting nexin-29
MHEAIFKIYQNVWEEEEMSEDWKKVVIISIHKKGDKTECGKYRGISLLNSAYKIFSKVLLNRISPYTEENLGEYQCGFRKGSSTIEQIAIIGQIIEKKYEFRQNL